MFIRHYAVMSLIFIMYLLLQKITGIAIPYIMNRILQLIIMILAAIPYANFHTPITNKKICMLVDQYIPNADIRVGESKDLFVVYLIWCLGIIFCILYVAYNNITIHFYAKKASYVNASRYNDFMTKVGNKKQIMIRESKYINTPMIVGLFKPTIVLPIKKAVNHLDYAIVHECVHYQHKDIFFRYFFTVYACVFWFNPVVWIFLMNDKKVSELYCDKQVIHVLGDNIRREYALALLEFQQNISSQI